jgi:glucose-1-phosphate adenylyltransferase
MLPIAVSEAHRHLHLTQRTYALVLAGGRGSRLKQLTDWRAKPGVPFAGKLKIIDFPLSNCVNSGIRRIAVLTQYKAQSLIRHIERGWGFLAANLGEYIDVARPSSAWANTGTAAPPTRSTRTSICCGMRGPDHVLMLAGDHVYKMDYAVMLAEHVASGAERDRGLHRGAAGAGGAGSA